MEKYLMRKDKLKVYIKECVTQQSALIQNLVEQQTRNKEGENGDLILIEAVKHTHTKMLEVESA